MKSFDIDAKYLIKKYIDSIEEYFRENAKLHPNEIDGLLNEINDFIYTRSGEITTDPENRVRYADVLKAIDECGSPSEICEQYLEQDQNDSTGHYLARLGDKTTKIKSEKESNQSFDSLEISKNQSFVNEEFSSKIIRNPLEFYIRSPLFSIYRIVFLLFVGYLLLMVIRTNPIQYISASAWWAWTNYGYRLVFVKYDISQSTYSICFFMTLYYSIIVLWELLIINRWKHRLTKEKNTYRKIDDRLILILSRFGLLTIFLKASVLLSFEYLLFIPIWVLLLLITERQMQSKFWKTQIAPKITIIGLRMSLTNNTTIKIQKESHQYSIKSKIRKSEILLFSVLLLFFGYTFLFPFMAIYQGSGIYYDRVYLYYVPYYARQFAIPIFLAIISIIFYIVLSKLGGVRKVQRANKYNYTLLNWMARLLTLKAIIIVVSYTAPIPSGYLHLGYYFFGYGYFFTFLVVLGWFIIEILVNSYGVKFTRQKIGEALIKVGGSPTIYIDSKGDSLVKNTNYYKNNENSVGSKDLKSSSISFSSRKWFLIGYKILFSIFITISIFIIVSFEIFLILVVMDTSYTYSGEIGSAFLLLGIHVSAVLITDTYSLVSNEPRGNMVKIGRIITLSLLGWIAIASILLSWDPSYREEFFFRGGFQLRFILTIGILSFSEIGLWRNKRERMKLGIQSNSFSMDSKRFDFIGKIKSLKS